MFNEILQDNETKRLVLSKHELIPLVRCRSWKNPYIFILDMETNKKKMYSNVQNINDWN